jgi:hypothetical protein
LESADGQYWICFVVLMHKVPQMPKQFTSQFKILGTGKATYNKFHLENPHFWS